MENPEKEVVVQEQEYSEQVIDAEPEKEETPLEEAEKEIVAEQVLKSVEIESKINTEVALPKEPVQEEQPQGKSLRHRRKKSTRVNRRF